MTQPPRRAQRRELAQAWEQLALPARAARLRAALVFSPANLAPLAWPRNVVVMHDAAVLREPRGLLPRLPPVARPGRAGVRPAGAGRDHGVGVQPPRADRPGRDRAVAPAGDPRRRRRALHAGGRPGAGGAPARPAAALRADDRHRRPAQERRRSSAPAAAALAAQGIELVWAGDRRPYFDAAAEAPGVRSVGYVDDGDLPGLYAGALAFVLASRYEGFGLRAWRRWRAERRWSPPTGRRCPRPAATPPCW